MALMKIVGFLAVLVIALASVGIGLVAYQASLVKPIQYPLVEFMGVNPLKGFAPWATDDTLTQHYSLVYANTTWREIEIAEGVYDFSAFDERNSYERWKANHTRIVFRLAMDVPRDNEHTDLPDWLMEKIGFDGDYYATEYGMGFSPNYSNPILIDRHNKLIEAIADRFEEDHTIAYIEVGSLGHWGEWHIKTGEGLKLMPVEDVRNQYVRHYLDVFPHSKLMMRRPFAIAKEKGLGLFNDMMGHEQATLTWLGWIANGGDYDQTGERSALAAMPNGWTRAPIGGEMTSSIPASQIFVTDLERTLDLLTTSHATFIGPGGYENDGNNKLIASGQKKANSTLGYAFHVQSAKLPTTLFIGDILRGEVILQNVGIAPIYQNWPVQIRVTNSLGESIKVVLTDPQLTQLQPKLAFPIRFEVPFGTLEDGSYQIYFSIIDPLTGQPAIGFSNENTGNEREFLLGDVVIDRPYRNFLKSLTDN